MIKYVHTNIIAVDWKKIAQFYINVFDCKFVPPERDITGEWISEGVGIADAHLHGCHLRLPGSDINGPTLEIYTYNSTTPEPFMTANKKGLRHIAFLTDDVNSLVEKVLQNGGREVGEIVSHEVEGVGILTFTYVADPEGNIIEIQKWD
ncbi:MAG: glyoxalase [Ignavibacteria bacterium GWF2_33_9]|nr:MAG: glyoxalase [Ignavibacteria bacterium GWF2_33_9]